MYKIRFNLGRGDNYKKWKVTYPTGDVIYINPKYYDLVLGQCKLKNRPEAAKKIHEGANKYPCAWIECKYFDTKKPNSIGIPYGQEMIPLMYNPKVAPYWVHGHEGRNVDNAFVGIICTSGNKVYAMVHERKFMNI